MFNDFDGSRNNGELFAYFFSHYMEFFTALRTSPFFFCQRIFDYFYRKIGNLLPTFTFFAGISYRFSIRFHRDNRIGESLVLEVAKSGPQLQPIEDGPALYNNAHTRLDATRLTMGQFAEIISRNLKLPVVDRTGLTGAFTFTLEWSPDAGDVANRDDAAAYLRSEMSRAIGRQLGLSLKVRRAPVEILVIDHAEKPSEN